MKVIIMLGPPGSGKGTQSTLLASKLGLIHLSTGEVLRKEITKGTELGKQANELMKNGNFVSDELASNIAKSFLIEHKDKKGFILDGFPRNANQAQILDAIFNELNIQKIQAINLLVDEPEVVKRLIKRGAELGRNDDNPEAIKNRIKIYNQHGPRILDYYGESGRIIDVNGVGNIDEIHKEIKQAINIF